MDQIRESGFFPFNSFSAAFFQTGFNGTVVDCRRSNKVRLISRLSNEENMILVLVLRRGGESGGRSRAWASHSFHDLLNGKSAAVNHHKSPKERKKITLKSDVIFLNLDTATSSITCPFHLQLYKLTNCGIAFGAFQRSLDKVINAVFTEYMAAWFQH